MKLTHIDEISGQLLLCSGLHIGSGNTEMHIGGSDNPVIKHPHTNRPYIPGSSLKGKIRSLLEWRVGGKAILDGKPMSYGKLQQLPDDDRPDALTILKLFGNSAGEKLKDEVYQEIGLPRLIFRDCMLSDEWVTSVNNKKLSLTETKMENTINRVSGVAEHPRSMERVPAGAIFNFCLVIRRFGEEEELHDLLFKGLKLLEMDSLGGSGSRGYGRVEFKLHAPWQEKLDKTNPWSDNGK
ncbi:MAG: type III-A CRISPR-associated RAMP protein Csm3 [Magnetococcales bacterium]|nr:type III-A CRISPR-associated RAMP protein Csm3 [Magnetococcales bacterium]